ncbi:MAG TPA: diguanylate cyclase [Nitrosospira sp.]|nr:diguanylate cyclase [Nitrosospira sp.]
MVVSSAILDASILIVDDIPANVELLERMLQLAGYTLVASTNNPLEVCRLHRENQYDLILLDLMMPTMDGFQVMECLTKIEDELGGYLSVLVITGQPGHKLRALQLGAKDVISKPFETSEILARVRNMLEIRLLNKEAKKQAKILEQLVVDLQKQIITDPLTDLYNRRFLQEYLPQEIAKAKRSSSSLAVLMFDLDFFKRINDVFGHEAGDAFLKGVAMLLQGCIRESDIVCRYGGEEFVLILSGASLDGAIKKAEKIRKAVLELDLTIRGKPLGKVSTSIGVAVYPEHGTGMEALLRAADEALYEAKENGRNRVVVSEPRNEKK